MVLKSDLKNRISVFQHNYRPRHHYHFNTTQLTFQLKSLEVKPQI